MMINRIILAVFLLLNFQAVVADIASDIAANVSAEQAAINAEALGLDAEQIAKQLVAAGITDAGVVASALVSAGFINTGTVVSALRAAGFTGREIAIVVRTTPGLSPLGSGPDRGGGSAGSPISLS